MFRTLPYILLFVVAALSQLLLFDNLTLSPLLSPLVYVIFILLLPLETPQSLMLLLGAALGVTMDWGMGVAGINSIATIFIAYTRIFILQLLCGKERIAEKGVPSEQWFGFGDFLRYTLTIIAIHHLIYFAFESLSVTNFSSTIIRFISSVVVSTLYVWFLARLFLVRNTLK